MNRQQCSFADSISWILKVVALTATLFVAVVFAQNPVPQIVGPVKPMAVAPGSGAFTLSVYGANFVRGAVVNWNGQPRKTTFVSARELQADILAADVAKNTAGLVGVTNPAPGGGNSSSSWAQVEVHDPITTIALKPPRSYPFGFYLLLPADFNHDGILDLVGEYGPFIDFNPGKGDGTFHFGSIAGRYYTSNGAAYGDFNGDGNLDIAFAESPPRNPTTAVGLVVGDGSGKFKLRSGINRKNAPTFNADIILAGDFNQDGKLDLLGSDLQGFSLFLGKGDGTFRHFVDVVDSTPTIASLVTGDFNGDGKLDIALLAWGPSSGTYLLMFPGNGDGTFQAEQTIFASSTILEGGHLQASDFNADGKLDLAFRTDSQICILLGNGDGTFQSPACYTVGTQFQFTYTVGDINSDGKADLIVSNYFNFDNAELDVLLGNGDGTFQSPQAISAPEGELGIVVGDFNSDGLLDVVFQTGFGSDISTQQQQGVSE